MHLLHIHARRPNDAVEVVTKNQGERGALGGEHDAERPGERPGDTEFVEDVLAQCMRRQPDTCVALDSLLTRTLLVLFVLALFVLIFAARVLVSIFRLVDQDAVLLAKS